METFTHKLSELVFDFDIYPRADLSAQHVGYIAEAMQAGAKMPPLVIDKKSKRIADGFHRGRGYRKVYGDDYEVECIEKDYKNDAEMFLDSCRYNSEHGATLDRHDRVHCAHLAKRLSVDWGDLAGVLHMDSDRLKTLTISRTAKGNGIEIPLKRTVAHMAGRKLNKRQREANKKLSGMNQQFYVNQLIELIESKMLDTADKSLMKRLAVLQVKLSEVV